ncbi:nucleobase-ascorbate transporter 7-like [Vicia villosa]|uniref:nucleobase-ascorbate transporter 7-like n=1 Tax=Vicia villosa TaxID=3911 RepID=UPI00273B732E|nr:nucleobase-ascorbate transporter 7-like [Vicia villosa]
MTRVGKFGALFASIPTSILAAVYCILFIYVGLGGLNLLSYCDLNNFRSRFILSFSLFMGFSIPHYAVEYGLLRTKIRWFNDVVNVPFSSGAFVSCILAIFLDFVLLRRSDGHNQRDQNSNWWDQFTSRRADSRIADNQRDRNSNWWARFTSRRADSRIAESLPL